MTNFEYSSNTTSESERLIRDQRDNPVTDHYQNDIYRDIIDALVLEGKSFDEIRGGLVEANVPGVETIESAEDYQPLLDRLTPGKKVTFQHHGNSLQGIIGDEKAPSMRIDTVMMQSEPQAVAILDIPIEYAGETESLPFYPRRSQESGDMILPGIKLL